MAKVKFSGERLALNGIVALAIGASWLLSALGVNIAVVIPALTLVVGGIVLLYQGQVGSFTKNLSKLRSKPISTKLLHVLSSLIGGGLIILGLGALVDRNIPVLGTYAVIIGGIGMILLITEVFFD